MVYTILQVFYDLSLFREVAAINADHIGIRVFKVYMRYAQPSSLPGTPLNSMILPISRSIFSVSLLLPLTLSLFLPPFLLPFHPRTKDRDPGKKKKHTHTKNDTAHTFECQHGLKYVFQCLLLLLFDCAFNFSSFLPLRLLSDSRSALMFFPPFSPPPYRCTYYHLKYHRLIRQ